MIIEYIRYQLAASTPADLIRAYALAGVHLEAAPECLGYDLSQCKEDAAAFILRIHWATANDHMEGFRRGPNFPPFLDLIRPFIGEIAEMRHYGQTDVNWKR